MTEHKNLLITLGEWWETRKRRAGSATAQPHPGGGPRFLRWFIPNGGTLILIALVIATQSIWARPFAATNAPGPSATTVNYQGRLADNVGVPLDGSYGMSFALYDAASAGNLVWGPEDHPAVPVSDGLFSVGLGSRTTGGIPTTTWNGDRYLEITVGGETLSPRELIRSVPIAGMALTVPDGAITDDKLARPINRITMLDRYVTLCHHSYPECPIDGEWHDVDIAASIPDTAQAVILSVGLSSPSIARLHVGPGGIHQWDYLSAFASGTWQLNQGIVKVIDDSISYQISDNADGLLIRMVGYVE